MKTYELVTEIFNKCSGNQMRDVFIREVQTDDTAEYVKNALRSHKEVEITEDILANGDRIYDVIADGLRERFSFTEV
ncbi:MAG: hypothetical protein J6P60_05770 [Lachnospiraceae bacterium]|nr:hypothetical protein [Lachnospiraceae bacterium]